MAVLVIEWQVSQHLEQPATTNWDPSYGPFLKVCKEFALFL